MQHAHGYAPLAIRNAAVPAAQFGPMASMVLLMIGLAMGSLNLIWLGIFAYMGVLIFQLVNLPVEFDASNRAKRLLGEMGIVDDQGASVVRRVLNAAGWTYVGGTLHSLMSVLYFIFIFFVRGRRE